MDFNITTTNDTTFTPATQRGQRESPAFCCKDCLVLVHTIHIFWRSSSRTRDYFSPFAAMQPHRQMKIPHVLSHRRPAGKPFAITGCVTSALGSSMGSNSSTNWLGPTRMIAVLASISFCLCHFSSHTHCSHTIITFTNTALQHIELPFSTGKFQYPACLYSVIPVYVGWQNNSLY